MINPTFSTVREDKSYINFLHRNQSVDFLDNNQNYFLSYSGRINDRTGLGLSVYQQTAGTLTNYGVLANYAYGIKLSENSNFTFGANISYYASGLDKNRINVADPDDPFLTGQKNNLIQFQPGFNLSFGKFDVGAYAENLFDYNLKTSKFLTDFSEKTYSGHLQYTHQFKNESGIMQDARLMPLARARKVADNDITLGGSLILDLPKIGWVQGGYDSFYGASAGMGVNLNKRLSLGYTMEKGLGSEFDSFGLTHEISLAYAFTPNLTEDRVMLEDDNLLSNQEEFLKADEMVASTELEELKKKLAENDAVLSELMFRQDSLEDNRQKDLERRFEMVMRMVRNETKGQRPDLEKRAEDLFLTGQDSQTGVASNTSNDGRANSRSTVEQDATNIKDSSPTRASAVAVQDNANNVDYTANANRQKNQNNTTDPKTTSLAVQDNTRSSDYNSSANRDAIKSRKFKNLDGVTDGYYVVANVYKGGKYMDKFMSSLNNQGFNSDYIDNPNNGLKYVYLQRYDTWGEAVEAYKSNMNGAYNDDLWIMNVDNRYTNERYASNVDKLQQKSSKYITDVPEKNVVERDKIAGSDLKSRTYKIDGLGQGFYIIANVFANPNNANRFVKLLNSYGLSASYFINPENNWRYVYVKRHDSWNNALISYYSKLNDTYDDKMWIMRVKSEAVT